MEKVKAGECIICRKHRGQVPVAGGPIHEDALISVSHAQLWGDEREHYLGHLFIEPKRHVAELADLSEAEAQALGLFTGFARMPPSLLGGGMASGGLGAAAPNKNLPADKAPQLAAGWFTSRLARALMEAAGAVHVYAFVIGDGVPHVHVHVIGRYRGAPREYWGPRVDEWPDAPHGAEDEIAQVADRVRRFLQDHSGWLALGWKEEEALRWRTPWTQSSSQYPAEST